MSIRERSLYPDVKAWLEMRLRALFPGRDIKAFDTSRFSLSSFLHRRGLSGAFPQSDAFEIEVDITGIIRHRDSYALAFIECKTAPITLKDVGQILGYSRVASPALAVIVSPAGMSRSLSLLLSAYNRVDLLEYTAGQRIKIATWDIGRKQVDPNCVFPTGELG